MREYHYISNKNLFQEYWFPWKLKLHTYISTPNLFCVENKNGLLEWRIGLEWLAIMPKMKYGEGFVCRELQEVAACSCSVLAYFKNRLVINHSCTWSFALCLVSFHQNNKKVISLSYTSCLIPTGSCYAMLLETLRPKFSSHQACFFTSEIMMLPLELHVGANIKERRIKL